MHIIVVLIVLAFVLGIIYNQIGYETLYENDYRFSSRRFGGRGSIDYSYVYYERHKLIKSIKRITASNSYFPWDKFDKKKFIMEAENKFKESNKITTK